MKTHLRRFFILALVAISGLAANAQDFDILFVEDFNVPQTQTPPAPWVEFVQDPADPALGGTSDGWEFGVTGYSGDWNVPASLDASGFAIANDDPDPDGTFTGQDRRDDQLLVGFFDMTAYDSLTILIDKFFNAQFGSDGFFLVGNATQAIIFPIAQGAAWGLDELTVVNGETYVPALGPFVFDNQMVIGFVHNDNGVWADGLAVDNVILAGWLPPCETTGLTQEPASPVAAVGGSTTTISASQDLGGEFSVVTNIQGSTEYVIDHTGGAYATVRTGSANGPVLDFGDTPLTITTLSTDDLYIIWSADNACSPGDGSTNTSTITGGAQVCAADAGTLFQPNGVDVCLGDPVVAAAGLPPSVPTPGYSLVYVVTDGAGNIDANIGVLTSPTFTPTVEGTYFIHAMVVFDADVPTILAEVPNGALAVANLFEENGGSLCGSLDLTGAGFNVLDCPDNDVCSGAVELACGDVVIGDNTNASDQIIGIPGVWYSFEGNGQDVTFSICNTADAPGNLYDTQIWLITGDCAAAQEIVANDDDFCTTFGPSELTWYTHPDTTYYLYVGPWGSSATVLEGEFELSVTCACPTDLDAGSLTPNATTACLDENGEAVLSATEGTAPQVPAGYDVAYVLTSGGTDYIIEQTGATPEFTVTEGGEYTIHTLVFTNTLDLSVVVPGQTPASAVLGIVAGDDNICAALDVTGTGSIIVNAPAVGATIADASSVCLDGGSAAIGAESDGNEVVPAGFAVAYVLTDADANLAILDANTTGDFTVNAEGNYVIHTLVYDPTEITDFTPFVGQTGGDVAALLSENGGTVCASLDVAGAPVFVSLAACNCTADAGSIDAIEDAVCLDQNGEAELSAAEVDAPVVPSGYDLIYVLTSGSALNIEATASSPSFTVTSGGLYTIHTLVVPTGTDLSGVNTGFEANAILLQGGGTVCGALDVSGAQIIVNAPEVAGTIADASPVCLVGGSASIGAESDGSEVVPAGFAVAYVLTDADQNLLILDANATGDFTVNAEGNYVIHTLVYDPTEITDFTPFVGQTGGDVAALLSENGGSVCASLDVAGAEIVVDICTGIRENLDASLDVYPNPSNGEFVIEVNGVEAMAQLNVMDLTGRVVYTEGAMLNGNFRKEFNLGVVSGTYLLQIITEEGMVTRKLQVK